MNAGSILEAGTVIGGEFVVVRLLGSGGMGAVYVVEQPSTGKQRALKMMHRDVAPNPSMQRRFEQEARVGAQIKSGHIVDVMAAGLDATTGLPYLVMDLLDGVDLAAYVRSNGPRLLFEVYGIFEQLCHGIAAAHAVGVVHRDLKPENIFLATSNQAGASQHVVKVLDFGIAKLVSERGTNGTAPIGSPLWMAPEQTEPGPVTPAADVWALGLIAYYLLAGHFWRSAVVPTATPMHVLREIIVEPIPSASERGGGRIPPGFDAWFARCVVRDPKARFQDAGEAWRAMQAFCAPAGLVAGASGRPVSFGPETMAETSAAGVPQDAREALRTILSAGVPPHDQPPVISALAVETPAPVEKRESPPPRAPLTAATQKNPWPVVSVGLALVLAVLIGMKIAAPAPPTLVAAATPLVEPASSAPAPATRTADPLDPEPRPTPMSDPPRTAPSSPTPTPPKASPKPSRDGFSDPSDGARQSGSLGVTMLVRDQRIRLLTRLVTNGSNVTDSVVREAVDWSSWEYLRCYQTTFKAAKTLPSGTVTVGFDILDQLPRHATLMSTTFNVPEMDKCVVGTVSGHTANGAGPNGAGHIVYAFKFLGAD